MLSFINGYYIQAISKWRQLSSACFHLLMHIKSHMQCLIELLLWQLFIICTMKFERQRGGQAVPDKYGIPNQQFMTFRNNPVAENSGRTVYSQQFDYKSLDRYDKPDERPDPASFNFRKNLKNLRSQDKYKQLKEEALLFQMTEENSQSQIGSIERGREELKVRFMKLKKQIKREQKKGAQLTQDIENIKGELSQLQETRDKQESDKMELQLILKDNEKNILVMSRRLEEYINRAEQMEAINVSIEDAFQTEVKTNRSNQHNLQFQKKLLEGIEELQQFSEQIQEKTELLQEEIDRLENKLQLLQGLDVELRNMLPK